MSARGVTAQELPENQDESVKGVVRNEILHGHVRPALALEAGEVPAEGAAVDAFTASLVVDTSQLNAALDAALEAVATIEPEEPVALTADGALVAEGVEVAVLGDPADEEDEDAAGAGE